MEERLIISVHVFRTAIASFVVAFLFYSQGFSQGGSGEVEMYFQDDSVMVEQGHTFTNLLVVRNTGKEEITFQELEPQENYPGLIFYAKATGTLQAGEEKRFPVKFIANLEFLRIKSVSIGFELSWKSTADSYHQKIAFSILRSEDRTIAISPFSRENFIHPSMPESTISLYVENRAYGTRNLKLEFQSLPEGLEITPTQIILTLDGLEKRMIEIHVSVRRQMALYPEYQIQVNAIDLADHIRVGHNRISVVALSHNRQISPGTQYGGVHNFAEVAFNQHSTGHNYLFLNGNQKFSLFDEVAGQLNLTADYYQEDGLYNIYDTWLELERKNTLLRLGNVYGSDYDYSITGRGGRFNTQLSPSQEIEVLALENNYHLFGTYFPQGEGAKMVGAKYRFGNINEWHGKISYLFDNDIRRSVNTHVANFVSSFDIRDRHNLSLEGGISHEKGLLEGDQHMGFSTGLNYDAILGQWSIQSLNSFSSKNYAGLSRGAFNTVQRIDYQFSNNDRGFILYQNSRVRPEYLNFQGQPEYTRPEYFYSTQAVKMGIHFSTSGWNFLISPQVVQQKNTYSMVSNELFAYRIQSTVGKSIGYHGLSLNTEYSYANIDPDMGWFHGIKANMAYRYKGFSIHGAVQRNPGSVIDLNSYVYHGQNFVNYNLYASYDFHALNHKLTGFISGGTNYSELYQNLSQNLAGNLEYKFLPSWAISGYFNYSDYRSIESGGYRGQNHQIRVGLKKYFNVATATSNHKISIVLYADENYNGFMDPGEPVLANEIVTLDHFIAITDEKGKVTFQNVPKGTYALNVNERASSRLTIDPDIVVDQNVKLEVGVVRSIRVTGRLSEVRQPYDDMDTDVTGVLVYARSQSGEIQSTLVNRDHEFEFFLEAGYYEIYVENENFEYHDPLKQIQVDGSTKVEPLVFTYSKKDRTIKIKKF